MTKKIGTGLLILITIIIAIGLAVGLTWEEDETAPEVLGLEADLYNEPVTPVFNEGTALLNGEEFSSGTAISEDGAYVLEVTDDSGNTTVKEFTLDQTVPEQPTVDEVDEGTETITGSAEAGSKVKLWSDEELLGMETAGDDGSFSLPVTPRPGGSVISVAAIDSAGNQSEMMEIAVRDVTAPDVPEVNAVTDQTATISGKAEPGATVQIYAGDNKLAEAVSNDEGLFEAEIGLQAGGTELAVVASDAAGNESEARAVEVTSTLTPGTASDAGSGQVIEPTYIDGILVVNKKYALPPDYAPGVNPTAQAALNEMLAAAAEAGHELSVISTYRSYAYQEKLYNRYVSSHGEEQAKRFAALPGHSEHQTGLTFDLGDTESQGDWLSGSFGDTPAGKWLADNAHKYGFIVRYPKGKEAITGYIYEPWHFRYLGVDNATKVYNSGLTLEEYLGISGS